MNADEQARHIAWKHEVERAAAAERAHRREGQRLRHPEVPWREIDWPAEGFGGTLNELHNWADAQARRRERFVFDRIGIAMRLADDGRSLRESLLHHPIQTGVLMRDRETGRCYHVELEAPGSDVDPACWTLTLTEVGQRD